uniref:Inorganic diphosphatase n=1 Tax=Corethron hystrix TaxID=216773 RepID=A0A7S1FVZ2_9STRA|mmetsp:Transcript_32886/g.75682  ORF Transcript_32886/g.75682 Transcript_32886/m.75682 type:complete len:1018 (+) Transcript_32886:136-3189(+)
MPRYAYAPLSVEESGRRSKRTTSADELVHQRMPMCAGICVLLAIVYVLSRTGGDHHLALIGAGPATVAGPDGACDLGLLRAQALEKSPPHIIECAAATAGASQSACHLPRPERYEALKQKGATLWMTGCSGAGKTTIATALEDKLVKLYGKHTYRLDGDNIRTGLNRDLGFSESDRAESVRRVGEMATLFSDAGTITLVGLISPYRGDRDAVRRRHEEQGIPFYEVFLDVPVDELKKRDPKGQYARVESGELKHFTCIDDPYEEPLYPEIRLKTHELKIEESVEILFRRLQQDGVLDGAPKLNPPGLPNPDGDRAVDLHVPASLKKQKTEEAATLPKVLITDVELNWLQVIGEGWAAPLRGFMREGTLLETLHFNSILVDPFNLTDNVLRHETKTDFTQFTETQPPRRVSMSVPITLSCTEYTKQAIENSGKDAVALVTQMGQTVAILRRPEIYANRKEEIVTRMFGAIDRGHPYIKFLYSGGPYLIGGEVELLDRIRYNDGLDKWRKTSSELMEEFKQKGADTVFAFQTRNPTHAGHAYLMKSAGQDLVRQGFKKPVLWLSPLGGWTKSDDVPLDVRVRQHEEVLRAGTSHPGGLDPSTTVMAIWPSPMVYAGPTEVQFHAKSRRSAGASYFVVGRDPAGLKGSMEAVAHKDDDLYDGDHGRYVLQMSPGIGGMKMLSFTKVMYDIRDNTMKVPDANRMDDFISISGTKMRALAAQGAVPCAEHDIPTDLLGANCVPRGFMVPDGWKGVVEYYQNAENAERWVPWSRPRVEPLTSSTTETTGVFGLTSFALKHTEYKSMWHDIPMIPDGAEEYVVNFVTEIPMYVTAKMELIKDVSGNPIQQDKNKDGSPRYYTYGTPFFNYGFIPQTWEDPTLISAQGNGGDNDPLDVMEVGFEPLPMGSTRPCRVLGSLELIDEGETDHKVICISLTDKDQSRIHSMYDLERVKPGTVDRLIHWLKFYKTSDGKGENMLARDTPTTQYEAMQVIKETNSRWKMLCEGTTTNTDGFWLAGEKCQA